LDDISGSTRQQSRQALGSGSWNKTLKVPDAASSHEILTLRGHTATVTTVAWSENDKRIVGADRANTLTVWEAETGQETLTLNGHISDSDVGTALSADRLVGRVQKTLKSTDS
jgi:WD40 repeat protein